MGVFFSVFRLTNTGLSYLTREEFEGIMLKIFCWCNSSWFAIASGNELFRFRLLCDFFVIYGKRRFRSLRKMSASVSNFSGECIWPYCQSALVTLTSLRSLNALSRKYNSIFMFFWSCWINSHLLLIFFHFYLASSNRWLTHALLTENQISIAVLLVLLLTLLNYADERHNFSLSSSIGFLCTHTNILIFSTQW